jgi:hypothetical protein
MLKPHRRERTTIFSQLLDVGGNAVSRTPYTQWCFDYQQILAVWTYDSFVLDTRSKLVRFLHSYLQFLLGFLDAGRH